MPETYLFRVAPSRLQTIMPGWRKAAPLLSTPRERTVTNLWRGGERTFLTRRQPDPAPEGAGRFNEQAVPMTNSGLGVRFHEVARLGVAIRVLDPVWAEEEMEAHLWIGPIEDPWLVNEVPTEVVTVLSGLSEASLNEVAAGWLQEQKRAEAVDSSGRRRKFASMGDAEKLGLPGYRAFLECIWAQAVHANQESDHLFLAIVT